MNSAENPDVERWERTEAAAWQGAWDAVPQGVREQLRLSKDESGSLSVFRAPTMPSWFFNRILVRVTEPVSRPQLDAQIERFVAAGTPYGVCVPPGAQPSNLEQWLADHGLQHTTTLARMVRTTKQLPTAGAEIQIRQVGREDESTFGELVTRGFGMPPVCSEWMGRIASSEGWRAYLAYAEGKPVGTGALFIHGTAMGPVGWLGFGSTLPEFRGRGIHRAMLARRMIDAADLGCRFLQTETNLAEGDEPTPSLDNMKRLGFEMAYARPNYVVPPPKA